jgi:hypothetical protein
MIVGAWVILFDPIGCASSQDVTKWALTPYEADYFFFEENPINDPSRCLWTASRRTLSCSLWRRSQ